MAVAVLENPKTNRYIVQCHTTLVVEAASPDAAIKKYLETPGLAVFATPLIQEDFLDDS